MVNTAIKYANLGLSIIPTKLDKSPTLTSWVKYQKEIVNENLIQKWFSQQENIAIVAGEVSGNLEVIDFDNHNNDIQNIFDEWKEIINNSIPDLIDKLVIETTVSNGYHVFYRCEIISNNTKLARRHVSNNKIDTFIETRGEGGYVIVAPSEGYKLIQNSFDNIPLLTIDERDCLLAAAYALNEVEVNKDAVHILKEQANDNRPGDEYNNSNDFKQLLQHEGWKCTQSYRNKEIWTRPDKKRGLSATYNFIPGKFYVFSTNAYPFEDQKTYSPFSIYTLLKYGDLSANSFKAATKQLLSEGYGKEYDKVKKDKIDKKIMKINKSAKSSLILTDNIPGKIISFKTSNVVFPDAYQFYYETLDAKGNYKIGINKSKLIEFFEYFGFCKYWITANISIFVKNENNIISEHTPETMFDFLKNIIMSFDVQITEHCDKFLLWETILSQQNKLINVAYLSTIKTLDVDFLNDNQNECYIPFLNGIAKITAESDEPTLVDYKSFNKCIWKDTIIKRNFNLKQEAKFTEKSMFGRFLEMVCSPENKEYPNQRFKRKVDEDRLLSLMSSIGYLIHTYKDPTVTKAIIYCEEQIADYDDSNGRTGKGLTFNAISKVRKHHLFNGKQIDFADKFFFQSIQQDTQVIVFDDVRKRFDFEALFSVLTEGISVEKKGQKPIIIPFERSPKVLITTNSVISNDSGSHRARKFEIEFSDYFSADYTPYDEFGTFMFERGWTSDSGEWDYFYSFMMYCVKVYLNLGLVTYKAVNLDERKLRADVPDEFIDYAYELIGKMKEGTIIYRDELYNEFTDIYTIYGPKGKNSKTQTIVTKWFNKVLKFKQIKTENSILRGTRKQTGWKLAA